MRINAFSDVCLRVVMVLSAAQDTALSTSRALSDEIATPYNHVSKAIIRLRDLGLVEVLRGRSGGVRITAAGRSATVGWLLRQLDTRVDLADCESPGGTCPLIHNCGLRIALRKAREAFYAALDDVVISGVPHGRRADSTGVLPVTRPLLPI